MIIPHYNTVCQWL